jgi:gas vesicle protein
LRFPLLIFHFSLFSLSVIFIAKLDLSNKFCLQKSFTNNKRGFKMRYEKEESSTATKLSYLIIGGGIGAVLALLFAPKSGTELREDIADATRKGLDKTKETAALVGERAGEYYEVSRERAGELYVSAQEKAADLAEKARDRAGELTGKAKEAVSQTANPFSAAIEAGKQAYTEEKRRTENTAITEGRPTYPVEEKILEIPSETEKDN